MSNQQTCQAGLTIQYINARNGSKPASIKGACGNYYTISDAAIAAGTFQQGAQGTIGYRISQKGFRIALAWNGVRIPQDPQGDSGGQPPRNGQYYNNGTPPPPVSPSPARPVPRRQDGPLSLSRKAKVAVDIAGACIASGLSQEEARLWYIWTLRTAAGLKTNENQDQGNRAPPPPALPLAPAQAADGLSIDDEIPF